ncbi:MAG: WD40 repeat domain-containing protein [Mycobacteriaceae bacterium]
MTEHPSPYVRRHLASHAVEGGVLEQILDADNLPHLDAVRLSELLRLTQAPPHSALWVLLSAWRSIKHRWSWDDPAANAAALDVALLASGTPPPERLRQGIVWSPKWAEWMTGGTVVGSAEGAKPRSAFGAVAGRPVLAATGSSEVLVWDAATGQLVGESFQAPGLLEGVAMGGDDGSSVVAISRAGQVTVWDAATRAMVQQYELSDNSFRGVTAGRLRGRWLVAAAGTTGNVYTRWLDSGEEALKPFRTSEWVRSLSLAETENRTLAAVGHSDGTVALWNLDSQQLLGLPIHVEGEVNAVAMCTLEDFGTLVAVGSSRGQAGVWEAHSGSMLGPIWAHPGEVRAVALAMVGEQPMLAAGCSDGDVLVADVRYLTSGTTLPHPTEVTTVEFGNVDGRTMVATTCTDGNTRLWDPVQPSAARVQVRARVGGIAIVERDGRGIEVLTGNDGAQLQWWSGTDGNRALEVDVTGMRPVRRMKWAQEPSATVAADYIDGRLTVLTSYLGNVQLWRLGKEMPGSAVLLQEYASKDRNGGPLDTALYVGHGRALFTQRDWDEPLRVVDAFTGRRRRLKLRHRGNVRVLAFHTGPQQIWLATATGDSVTMENAVGGGSLGPPLPTIGWPSAVALGRLSGGEALAVLTNGEVRLWDPRSGEELVKPIVTSPSAADVAWARLGNRDLLLTRHFATIRVWNPRTGRKLSELPFGTSIDTMAVHPSADGTVRIAIGGPGVVFTELGERPRQSFLDGTA